MYDVTVIIHSHSIDLCKRAMLFPLSYLKYPSQHLLWSHTFDRTQYLHAWMLTTKVIIIIILFLPEHVWKVSNNRVVEDGAVPNFTVYVIIHSYGFDLIVSERYVFLLCFMHLLWPHTFKGMREIKIQTLDCSMHECLQLWGNYSSYYHTKTFSIAA